MPRACLPHQQANAKQEINALVAGAAPGARGAVLASFYTVSYAGLVLPSVVAGLLITYQGMTTAVNRFSAAAALLCVLLLICNVRAGHPRE
ncbi:hypothetical protein ACQP1W_18435 [Spirillospora sp. CA-255316]